MNKHVLIGSVLGFMTMAAVQDAVAVELSKPNILFCLADDWGWPHAGAYGDKVIKTPTFDRLAKEGVLFEHAFVSSPSCSPCRNSILTGQQFYRLGPGANLRGTLEVEDPNFMVLLRDAGYQIGHWRKAWGPGDYGPGGYTEHPCGPESEFDAFMKGRDPNKPFCFWFGTSDPHRPYAEGSGAKSGIDINKIHVPTFYPNTKDVRSDIADYYFEVQRWDTDVGRAIKLIEEVGELDNTIIVMTGDHGMPFPRCKANLYDWGIRVPLAIRWGGKTNPDRRITDFVSFTDIAPTFLDAAGIQVPTEMTGSSLLPIMNGEAEGRVDKERNFMVFGRERHVLCQKSPSLEGYPSRGIRTDQWLLILNLKPDRWPNGVPFGGTSRYCKSSFSDVDPGPTKSFITGNPEYKKFYDLCFAKRPAVELYDCKNDPDQVKNLAKDPAYSTMANQLKEQLLNYLESTGDPRFTDEPVQFDDYPHLKPPHVVNKRNKKK
ncbi:sulfatase family protein [Pontiella sulfatireligans]|uniref:Arylsulfatase n=1 Tax=Pontiella sulfatireligans TaxID=2750658 RepID=A0A6C2UQW5_9BACT|nr:sulfatase [Pontiella sulfatireligans]SPS74530.1 sulfatase S1_8 [Kiritimatiellales bacterium]VGO22692.1 Arylsulfatase [Pontiella sulfatireligans]